jgi:hypothetical protein
MMVIRRAGLDRVVPPAHWTHLMHPFDVSVARAVKVALTFYRNEFRFDAAAQEALLNPVRPTHWTEAKCLQLIDFPECLGPKSITTEYTVCFRDDRIGR